mmetsp:Transcript_30835/g.58535  ORF Transcript_30835/g.58535 Transcript_30835/m.58535 type:complete len:237 (-) Transcript_30835:15-725(-)
MSAPVFPGFLFWPTIYSAQKSLHFSSFFLQILSKSSSICQHSPSMILVEISREFERRCHGCVFAVCSCINNLIPLSFQTTCDHRQLINNAPSNFWCEFYICWYIAIICATCTHFLHMLRLILNKLPWNFRGRNLESKAIPQNDLDRIIFIHGKAIIIVITAAAAVPPRVAKSVGEKTLPSGHGRFAVMYADLLVRIHVRRSLDRHAIALAKEFGVRFGRVVDHVEDRDKHTEIFLF